MVAPRQRLVFFTRRRRRRVSIYQSFSFIRPRGRVLWVIIVAFKTCKVYISWRRGKSYAAAKSRTRRLRLKKTKHVRGANPRPIVLNASTLPLHHCDLLYFSALWDSMIDNLNASPPQKIQQVVGARRWRSNQ